MLRRATQRGFTIVELLIVIVIVGILAALVIVTYNGVQQRANNTQTIDAAGKYVRSLILYMQDKGDYPRSVDVATSTNACLGKNYSGNICANIGGAGVVCGTGQANRNTTFETRLGEYMSAFPDPSGQVLNWCNQQFTGIGYWYGANTYTPSVHFYLSGDVACPTYSNGVAAKSLQTGNTKCTWTLSAP